jgi:hypothetical protein
MFDMKSDLQLVRMGGATLSGTTPANTSLIDMQGFSALTVALTTGTVTDAGTAAGFTLKLQHSDTTVGTDFVDCATSDVIGANLAVTEDADDDKAIGTIGYRGNKRYVRAVITGTTGTDAVVVVFGIKERAATRAVTAIAAAVAAT